MKYACLLFLFLCLNSIEVSAQKNTATKPKILIFTTGGTIASINGKPMIDGPILVQAVPELTNYAEIEVVEFSKIGSSQMTPANWLELSKKINEVLAKDSSVTGIIITHGTDTMEETAFFLNLTVKSNKPVILVGSMRSSNEISADGPANLLNAVRVAIDKKAIGQGVLVVLNEHIAAARNVFKNHNRNVHTFQSPELGYLGFVDPDKVVFYQKVLHPHTDQTDFDIRSLTTLPKVVLVQDYTGFDATILDYLFNQHIEGLVVQTFAGGRASAGVRKGLQNATNSGIPVIIASGVPNGRIIGTSPYDFPAIFSNDFRGNKARILLMLCLVEGMDMEGIKTAFEMY